MQKATQVRRVAIAVAMVTSLLVVGGCTGGGSADDPTTAAPVGEVTPSPSPSPTLDLKQLPERPAAMDEPTTDGAIAAATYVLELYTYTVNSGDVAPWEAIALDSCTFCQGVVADVTETASTGDVIRGGAIAVQNSRATEIAEDRWFSVNLDVTQETSQRVDAAGDLVGENPASAYTAVFALSWDGGWRVDEMGVQTPETASSEDEAG